LSMLLRLIVMIADPIGAADGLNSHRLSRNSSYLTARFLRGIKCDAD